MDLKVGDGKACDGDGDIGDSIPGCPTDGRDGLRTHHRLSLFWWSGEVRQRSVVFLVVRRGSSVLMAGATASVEERGGGWSRRKGRLEQKKGAAERVEYTGGCRWQWWVAGGSRWRSSVDSAVHLHAYERG
ncbi:UDP-D-glucuronate 4-epimerase 3 [Striga asiatica]|uniref:UDP-D-glucuronate 4-epimerase 3 n=1 Tax=Striga asiatica TaxID=4170 RepID=A0A5A7QKR5_STRAF|nr:UDP-D-glucuronate 4-epimerase 3 [Striga asiatica]